MASLMDDLLGILQKEEGEYRRLLDLAKEKRQVIISANVDQLEKITNQEQEVTDILHNLERKRNSVITDMAVVLGKNPDDLTIENMIAILEKQPVEQKRLIESRAALREALDEMMLWNSQNQVLLQNALELVEFDLTLFKSLRQAPETANYNKDAYNTGALLGSGEFDAKQ